MPSVPPALRSLPDDSTATERSSARDGLRLPPGAGLAAVVIVVLAARALGAGDALGAVLPGLHAMGWAGLAAVAVAYVAAALLGLPCAPISAAAGLALGPVTATLVAVPSMTVAAAAGFGCGRIFPVDAARLEGRGGWVARAVRALEGRGFRAVLLLRLTPFAPFGLVNYALGASPVRWRPFLAATALGTLPVTAGFALAGALLGGAGGH